VSTQPPDDLACIDEVELITDYLEGALPESERRRVEAHLDTCPGCTEYLAQIRAVAGSLEGLRAETAFPPALRDPLIAALRDIRDG
jgi:anti-sigma factor RsiW